MIAMLTSERPHRRLVRYTPGAVVSGFSNRSVFTRARLLRGGQPLPNPEGNYNAKKQGKTHPQTRPRELMVCRNRPFAGSHARFELAARESGFAAR